MNAKAKWIIFGSVLQQLVAMTWFGILMNDPSAYKQHDMGEWLVIIATSSVVLMLGVVTTIVGVMTNPNQVAPLPEPPKPTVP